MKLLSAPPSPFGRKVKIVAAEKGLLDRISVEMVDTTTPDQSRLMADNPLGKIPVLILDDGTRIYDSAVICDVLDEMGAGPRLIPVSGAPRARTLTLAALGDGLMEAALLMVYEKRYRPEDKWVPAWLERQQQKIDAALATLEADPPAWTDRPDYGDIAIACALGYLDLRHEGRWRAGHPRLVALLDRFAAGVPSFAATRVTA
jgi:glutathione S-transferase